METHTAAKRGHEPPDAVSKRQKAQAQPLQPSGQASKPLPPQQEEVEPGQDPVIHIFNPLNYPRKRASIACEICRVRKTRCDAARPSCSSCVQLGVACTYRKLAIGVRPEQAANESFLSSIASRLDRIEALILDQNDHPGLATSYAATSPSALTTTGSSSYPTPSSSGAVVAVTAQPTPARNTRKKRIGFSMYAMSQLNDHEPPSALKMLQYEESETFLENELKRGKLLYQAGSSTELNTSPTVCWMLLQYFAEKVLTWFPLFNHDRCVEVVNKLHQPRSSQVEVERCLALFILALGALSKANHIMGDSPATLSGLDYFCAASDISDLDKESRYTILEIQCHIMKALYLLLCLCPLQASDAVFSAARSILTLFDLPSACRSDPHLQESCHRAYWTCFLLEHELVPLVSYNPQLLQSVHEFVPLPLSQNNERSIYWFLAEISLRRIFTHCIEDIKVESHLMYNPKITEVLYEQLLVWYNKLPPGLKFELDIKPLLDHQKAFLRGQYYVLLLILYWPSVVRLLTKEPDSKKQHEELLNDSRNAMKFGVAYIFATESLLLERHQMLFGNLTGTFYATMLLIASYDVPALESVVESVQQPSMADAICKSYELLSLWAEVPSIRQNIRRIEKHMLRLRLLPMKDPASATATGAPNASLPVDVPRPCMMPGTQVEGAVPGVATAPVPLYGMRTVGTNPMSITQILRADTVGASHQLAAWPRDP